MMSLTTQELDSTKRTESSKKYASLDMASPSSLNSSQGVLEDSQDEDDEDESFMRKYQELVKKYTERNSETFSEPSDEVSNEVNR